MRRGILFTALAGMLAAGGLAACSDDGGSGGDGDDTPFIGVILPDTPVLGPLGDRRPQVPGGGVQGRRRRVRHPERPGRQDPVPDHRRPDDHQRRQRPDDRQPGLRHRQGRAGQGQGARASPPSTTTGSPWAAAPTTTSASTTWRSASCRARAWCKCLTDKGVKKPVVAYAQRLADRQQRHPVQGGLRLGAEAASTTPASTSRARTRPCRTGTTPRPAPSSSRC